MANKFNIHWQIVRVKARDIKNVDQKIAYVLDFLNKNKNAHNLDRVTNWLKMTGVAYKGSDRDKFTDALAAIDKSQHTSTEDMHNDLSKISRADLQLVYKDLSTRKYGFQFKKVPKDHTEFMEKLKKELE